MESETAAGTPSLLEDGNFAQLQSEDAYGRYFQQLGRVARGLLECYRCGADAQSHEARVVQGYLQRLLFTVQALRLKYSYHAADRHSLWIDVTESGFPNGEEISRTEVELRRREEQLMNFAPLPALKEALLNNLLRGGVEPRGVLEELSGRAYYDMLDQDSLLLPYTPGTIVERGSPDGEHRHYVYSWACYDYTTNRPYIHVMSFDQDAGAEPLVPGSCTWTELIEVIRFEGTRAADVAIVAAAIDGAIESIHPKILKRLCIGPLYSRLLLEGRAPDPADPRQQLVRRALAGDVADEDDYMLFFQDEIVFSKRQEISRSILSPRGRVREIFAIEETDPECFARRASVIHHYVLLPHRLLQHMDAALAGQIPGFSSARKFAFNECGEVHGI